MLQLTSESLVCVSWLASASGTCPLSSSSSSWGGTCSLSSSAGERKSSSSPAPRVGAASEPWKIPNKEVLA